MPLNVSSTAFRKQIAKTSLFPNKSVRVSSDVILIMVTLTVFLASRRSGLEFLALNVEFQTRSPPHKLCFSFQ